MHIAVPGNACELGDFLRADTQEIGKALRGTLHINVLPEHFILRGQSHRTPSRIAHLELLTADRYQRTGRDRHGIGSKSKRFCKIR